MLKYILTAALLLCCSAKAESVLLTEENTAIYRSDVSAVSTTLMQLELQKLVELRGTKDYPLYLVMDCPGGSIYMGNQFIQYAKKIRNLKTVTIFAASMCSAIVEQLPGERLITENGVLMFHRAKGSFEGQFEEGEVESQLAFWKSVVRDMEQKNSDRMSMPLADYKAKVANEWWIWGKDNITTKAADKLVDIVCSAGLIASEKEDRVMTFFGPVNVIYSGCPLFRIPKSVEAAEEE